MPEELKTSGNARYGRNLAQPHNTAGPKTFTAGNRDPSTSILIPEYQTLNNFNAGGNQSLKLIGERQNTASYCYPAENKKTAISDKDTQIHILRAQLVQENLKGHQSR